MFVRFWSRQRVVIGSDFNAHEAEGRRGDEELLGSNCEGEMQMLVDFAKSMEMAVAKMSRYQKCCEQLGQNSNVGLNFPNSVQFIYNAECSNSINNTFQVVVHESLRVS